MKANGPWRPADKKIRGEMSELAEGARLEIACTAKSGTEGSNPSLSAILFLPLEYTLRC